MGFGVGCGVGVWCGVWCGVRCGGAVWGVVWGCGVGVWCGVRCGGVVWGEVWGCGVGCGVGVWCGVRCGVWCGGAVWVVVGEVAWVIQASCFLQRFLRQNIQDDDSMFELDSLEILTQKQKKKLDRPSQSVCQSSLQALYHFKWRLGENLELRYLHLPQILSDVIRFSPLLRF